MKKWGVMLGVLLLITACGPPSAAPDKAPSLEPELTPEEIAAQQAAEDNQNFQRLLRITLSSKGLENVQASGEGTILLSYTTTTLDQDKEIGFIALTFLGIMNEGWEVDSLIVDVNDGAANWEITKDWVRGFKAGEFLPEDVAFLALQSYETT